jgi:kynurenine 3-monooxygenase
LGAPLEDKSMMLNLYMNLKGSPFSYETIDTNEKFLDFMKEYFLDIVEVSTSLEKIREKLKVSHMENVSCYPWTYGKFTLVGDSAHVICPYTA